MANTVLWVYIALLLVGGLMGFIKAGSKVSLITSVLFAVLLALSAANVIPWAIGSDMLLGLLLVVFIARYAKTKKFMPSGLMLVVTLIALIVHLVLQHSA